MKNILIVSPHHFPEETLTDFKNMANVKSAVFTHEELSREIEQYDAVLTRTDVKFDKEILSKAKKLRVIGSATTGLNHIDVDYANSKGIKIISLQGTHTIPTAECTFSLMLALAKKIPWAHDSLKSGVWERHKFFNTELQGKTLGIIGFGRIGSRIAQYSKAFGMKVMTYDPYVNVDLAKQLEVKVTTLDDVLQNSDIITVHAFLSPETTRMINSNAFSKMKNTVFLINAARGEIIDEDALIDALESKKIAGAALDVFQEEPLPNSSRLVEYAKNNDNLIITPHISASSKESIFVSAKEIVEKVKEFLNKSEDVM